MKVTVQYAREYFDDILSAAESGEDVEIVRPDQSCFRLTLVNSVAAKKAGGRILGAGRGELRVPSEEEWCAMDRELERAMNDSPLFSPEAS